VTLAALSAGQQYALVCAAILAAGRKPRGRMADLMIAAVAMANDLPLHTANPDGFAGLESLLRAVAVRSRPRHTETQH
jgi:predicted nucleic acid-binding protein